MTWVMGTGGHGYMPVPCLRLIKLAFLMGLNVLFRSELDVSRIPYPPPPLSEVLRIIRCSMNPGGGGTPIYELYRSRIG